VSSPPSAGTVAQAFQATAAARASYPALRAHGGEIAWTWAEYRRHVRECAAGLAGLGCARGDTLACWLTNRPEFHVADIAAAHLGVGSFSLYPSSTAQQAACAIAGTGCRILVTEKRFLDRALDVRASGTTALRTIVCLNGGEETTLSWQELIECRQEEFDLEAAAAAVRADDLLTVMQTFEHAAAPKLVQLTHADVLARVAALQARFPSGDGWGAISWQPMSELGERLCAHYLPLVHGRPITTCADPGAVAALLPEIRPEIFWARPELWEQLRVSVLARFDASPERAAADRAAALAGVGLEHVRVAVVGAAPCRPELIGFWRALGVPLDEVPGLSDRPVAGGENADYQVNAPSDRGRGGAEIQELNTR
jgi:long-chain acyl-CoA synthetase